MCWIQVQLNPFVYNGIKKQLDKSFWAKKSRNKWQDSCQQYERNEARDVEKKRGKPKVNMSDSGILYM